MKIGIPEPRFATAALPARVPAGEARSGEPVVSAIDSSVKVKLSDAATALAAPAERSADFDAEKVSRIAKAIASGTFKVDSGAAADKMIDNARQLLVRPSESGRA